MNAKYSLVALLSLIAAPTLADAAPTNPARKVLDSAVYLSTAQTIKSNRSGSIVRGNHGLWVRQFKVTPKGKVIEQADISDIASAAVKAKLATQGRDANVWPGPNVESSSRHHHNWGASNPRRYELARTKSGDQRVTAYYGGTSQSYVVKVSPKLKVERIIRDPQKLQQPEDYSKPPSAESAKWKR